MEVDRRLGRHRRGVDRPHAEAPTGRLIGHRTDGITADEIGFVEIEESIEANVEGGVLHTELAPPSVVPLLGAHRVEGIGAEVAQPEIRADRPQRLVELDEVGVIDVKLPTEFANKAHPQCGGHHAGNLDLAQRHPRGRRRRKVGVGQARKQRAELGPMTMRVDVRSVPSLSSTEPSSGRCCWSQSKSRSRAAVGPSHRKWSSTIRPIVASLHTVPFGRSRYESRTRPAPGRRVQVMRSRKSAAPGPEIS